MYKILMRLFIVFSIFGVNNIYASIDICDNSNIDENAYGFEKICLIGNKISSIIGLNSFSGAYITENIGYLGNNNNYIFEHIGDNTIPLGFLGTNNKNNLSGNISYNYNLGFIGSNYLENNLSILEKEIDDNSDTGTGEINNTDNQEDNANQEDNSNSEDGNIDEKKDFKYIFQRPSYIIESDIIKEKYICDNTKSSCSINIKLLNIDDSEIGNQYICKIDYGFTTSEDNKCNPNTIKLLNQNNNIKFSIYNKESENLIWEKQILIIKIDKSEENKENNTETQNNSNQDSTDIQVENDNQEIETKQGNGEEGKKENNNTKDNQEDKNPDTDQENNNIEDNQDNTKKIIYKNFKYIFQRPSYIIDSNIKSSMYYCDPKKDSCKVNFKLTNLDGTSIKSDYYCRIDFPFNTTESNKCNPASIILSGDETDISFNVYSSINDELIWNENIIIKKDNNIVDNNTETNIKISKKIENTQNNKDINKKIVLVGDERINTIGFDKNIGIYKGLETDYYYLKNIINFEKLNYGDFALLLVNKYSNFVITDRQMSLDILKFIGKTSYGNKIDDLVDKKDYDKLISKFEKDNNIKNQIKLYIDNYFNLDYKTVFNELLKVYYINKRFEGLLFQDKLKIKSCYMNLGCSNKDLYYDFDNKVNDLVKNSKINKLQMNNNQFITRSSYTNLLFKIFVFNAYDKSNYKKRDFDSFIDILVESVLYGEKISNTKIDYYSYNRMKILLIDGQLGINLESKLSKLLNKYLFKVLEIYDKLDNKSRLLYILNKYINDKL